MRSFMILSVPSKSQIMQFGRLEFGGRIFLLSVRLVSSKYFSL
nr:MAG TPA: hypothetical protein [Caudoviricetes sp.]